VKFESTSRVLRALALAALGALGVGALCTGTVSCSPGPAPAPAIPRVRDEGLEAALRSVLSEKVGAVERAPRDADAWGALAIVYDAHDYRDEALACYRRAEALAPKEPRWSYHYGVAATTLDQADALAAFDRAEARGSEHPPLFVRRGLGHLLVGEVEAARADLARATKLDPKLAAAWLARARAAFADDDVDDAAKALDHAAKIGTRSGEIHGLFAELHRRRGEAEAAAATLERVTDVAAREPLPDAIRAAVEEAGVTIVWTQRRAKARLDAGDAEGALAAWRRAEERAPADPAVRLGVSDLLLRLRRNEDAEAHLIRTRELLRAASAAASDPAQGELTALLAQVELQQGIAALALQQDSAAATHFTAALEHDPEAHVARGNLGVIRLRQGRTEEGLQLLRQVSKELGAESPVRINLLSAVIDAGLWAEAETLVAELQASGEEDPFVLFLEGRVHVAQGHLPEAAAAFERVAALQPLHESAPVNAARVYRMLGDEARAAAVLRAALERQPDSLLLHQRLAWLLATAEDQNVVDGAEATRLAKLVLGASPEHPEFLSLAAAAFASVGEYPAAVTHEELAIETLAGVEDELAPARRPELLAAMRERLHEYRAGRRWREPLPKQPETRGTGPEVPNPTQK